MTQGWQYVLTERSRRDMRRLSREARERIFLAPDHYVETRAGNVRKLHGRTDEWRLRVGDYRVVFECDASRSQFIVHQVRHRRDAYRL